jgi:tetratricopeptide (TPR) repeat protein
MVTALFASGCSSFGQRAQVRSAFAEADQLYSQGSYQPSLERYAQIVAMHPVEGDRALFEMGVIYAHPKNEHQDLDAALQCFHRLIAEYPASEYRHDSERMIFYINNGLAKDQVIAAQQTRIGTLQQEIGKNEQAVLALQKQIEALEQKVFAFASQAGPVEKILVEKRARQLKLISRGEVIKTYRIALGGNPDGPKERQGDNKTPEGLYSIDAKNWESRYHLSLHISYPNERDRQRANELGGPPGGDIMIHGIKNGFAWVGNAHTEVDWTRGCIAVTDEEIEEIDKLVPIGTPVEIRP